MDVETVVFGNLRCGPKGGRFLLSASSWELLWLLPVLLYLGVDTGSTFLRGLKWPYAWRPVVSRCRIVPSCKCERTCSRFVISCFCNSGILLLVVFKSPRPITSIAIACPCVATKCELTRCFLLLLSEHDIASGCPLLGNGPHGQKN
jgi:hypothetical protein